MGSRMAAHLIESGHELTVYNRTDSAANSLVSLGAKKANTIEAALTSCELIISMLSTPEVVSEVFLSENGVLKYANKGVTWIDCSTVNPSFSVICRNAAKQQNIQFLDAPVAGSKPQAETGDLVFFVGGDLAVFEKHQEVLSSMGKKCIYIGQAGHGSAFKMVVNLMLAQSMITFSEAVQFGQAMGLDTDFLLKTIPYLPVAAPFTQLKSPLINEQNFEPQFPLEWMTKDLRLCLQTAAELNHPIELTEVTKKQFDEAMEAGMGRLDFSAIFQFLKPT